MSRRKQATSSAPPAKRRRAGKLPEFGAPTADDASLLQPNHFPSPTALSTRTLPQRATVPSLSSLAARSFVTHIQALSENDLSWTYSKQYLKRLPDALVPRLFSMLRSSCPMLLSHGLIVLYLFRGPSLVLSSDLPGVQKQTILSVPNNPALRVLHLTGFDKFSDATFASILPSLPHLRTLVLRGCSKVGTKTAEAIGDSCPSLTTLNLNYTSVTPTSLLGPLTACTNLEVLKVAGIPNWTDSTFAKLLAALAAQEGDMTFPNMKSLKFRQLSLSETSTYPFIARCPNLTRLDVSFTRLHRLPPSAVDPPPLQKLSLTSTALPNTDVVSLVDAFPNLRTLYLGALGGGQAGSSASISNTSAMTMSDNILRLLTDVIAGLANLEKLSLVGNAKLGLTASSRHGEHGALADFVRRVGRKCKHLNLSGLPYLRSQDLRGLMSMSEDAIEDGDEPACKIEELALNNTGVDDDAAQFIARCSSLVVLQVAGTKFTGDGLFLIIDACSKLETLDLTSCRGIKVADRRRFFEVWENEWKDT